MSEDLTQKIDELNAALEAAGNEITTPAFKTEDELGRAQKYLSEKANKALAKKALNLIVQEGDKTYVCVYFGVRVPKDGGIEQGVEKLSGVLNSLAERGLIHSALAPMISLDFVRMAFERQCSAVCSYVLVPSENVEEMQKLKYALNEDASNIETLGNPKVELHDGVVGTVIRLSYGMNMIAKFDGSVPKMEDRLQAEIQEFLNVMPKGTTVLSTEPLPISDLSAQYEVKFHSPLLQKAKRVELSHVREIAVLEGKLEQFNLLLGVRYFDSEGKELYKF